MNKRLKYSLIIVSTLIIGMIIGFLVSGRITRTRVNKMKSYYTNTGFNREFKSILHPSPEQYDEILPILEKYAGHNRDLMIEFREDQRELFFDLKDELEPHLTNDQLKRLDHVWEKRKHHFQNNRNNLSDKGRKRFREN